MQILDMLGKGNEIDISSMAAGMNAYVVDCEKVAKCIVDLGASIHMVGTLKLLNQYKILVKS